MVRCSRACVYLVLSVLVFGSSIQPAYCGFFGFGWLSRIYCLVGVCCNEKWIIKNFTGLEDDITTKLHGQHLVKKTVLGHVKAHLRNKNPSKALVLSFHGPTGVGKNFVSRIIAENVFRDGMRNKYVHLISSTKEFQHDGMVPFYKEQLKEWIESNVTKCERSLFIFDEVDKLPAQLLDVIKPYLDHYDNLSGINYRKSMFLFLSNSGTSTILNKTMDNWKAGKAREELELRQVEHDVMLSVMNEENKSGLWHSQLIMKSLITAFIPLLPLEKSHVRKCIEDNLLFKRYFDHRNDIPSAKIDEIMEELKFIPEVEQVFSATGCKRVSEKVDYVMSDYDTTDSIRTSNNQLPKDRRKDEI